MKKIVSRDGIKEMTFEEVLEEYKFLVRIYANKWSFYEYDDMRQLAEIALWKAYKTHDYKKGFQFKTYAEKIIHGNLVTFSRDQNKPKRYLDPKNKLSLDVFTNDNCLESELESVIYGDFEEHIVNRIIIKDAISKIKGKNKRYLKYIYYFMAGFRNVDIAIMEGKNESAISRKTQRAFELLRKIITNTEHNYKITKEELEELYVNKKLSMEEIGRTINVNRNTVKYYLIQYDIPRRKSRAKNK